LLFNSIVETEYLDPAILQKLQKLRNAASFALANSNLQRAENINLITAEKTKKKRSNREKGKQYAYGRVMNEETIREREAYCMFQDCWAMLSRIQPNLLGKGPKKPAKKPAKPDPQLSPSVFRLLSPGRPKTPAKAVSPTQGRKIGRVRKALVGKKAGPGRKAPVQKTGVEKVVEQVVDVDRIVSVVQTRSGRNVVKKPPFEAGKN
jgi:hypothetical protein